MDIDHNDMPTLVCLHYLGGSAATWSGVCERLAGRVHCLALDLPGFGDAASTQGYNVQDMANNAAGRIAEANLRSWVLAGHSMGAKVAAVLARRAEDGEARLAGLRGLILLGGSPPSPEPMEEQQRQSMLEWFTGDPAGWERQARNYIAKNVASPLDSGTADRAVADVLRMHGDAWAAWLHHGSREDWAARIGILQLPALILAGSADADLGMEAQERLQAPHYASHRLQRIMSGHLLPLERPAEVAHLIAEHVSRVSTPS